MAPSSSIVEQAGNRQLFQELSPTLCYALASIALFAPWIGYYCFDPFGFDTPIRDTWHHVAVLRELMLSPLTPSNPHIPTEEPSRYYTPINILAALLGKALNLSPYSLFGYMGAASCIGLITGCWGFGRHYYGSSWAPLILLVTLLLAWGLQRSHVGLHNYATLITSASYPSTTVFAFGFLYWKLALRSVESSRNKGPNLLALALFTAIILLTHQLSGIITGAIAGSLVLFNRRADANAKAITIATMALGSTLVLAWPYFNILDVISSVEDPRWRTPDIGLDSFPMTLILAAPALVGVLGFRRLNGSYHPEIFIPALIFGSAYIALSLHGSPIAHRIAPAAILLGHLGLAWLAIQFFADFKDHPNARTTIIVALCLASTMIVFTTGERRIRDIQARASTGAMRSLALSLASYMPANSISFATDNVVYPLQSTGRRVVSIPRPEPTAPSLIERQGATDHFFAEETDQQARQRLVRHWNATHAVFVAEDVAPHVARALLSLGHAKRFSHGVVVVTFDRNVELTEKTR